MCHWMRCAAAVIPPDMVPRRHYFLEMLQSPEIIWGIRICCIAAAVAACMIYRNRKRKSGE